MQKHIVFGVLLASSVGLHAQTINVRGKVTNASGAAVSGAIVELLGQKMKDTTGADGMYSLTKGTSSVRNLAGGSTLSLEGTYLRVRLAERAALRLKVSDASGKVLWKEAVTNATGQYAWNLEKFAATRNLLIIQASIGSESQSFRYLPMAVNGASEFHWIAGGSTSARLAKAAAGVDSLKVFAGGYALKTVDVAALESNLDVALEVGNHWGPLKNAPWKSAGCGKAAGVTNGEKTITSGGQSRRYTIDIPSGYDMNKPYKFFYCSHWISSNMGAVTGQNYYFLKPLAASANEPAIFLAPQALPGNPNGTWNSTNNIDNNLFVDIMAFVKANLCIDESRVFATGFSFGGMMTYSLSENRQMMIRAAVGIGPANYNIYVPPKTKQPIAWMSTTGMSDGTTPWVNNEAQRRGAKFIALDHATNNGCAVSGNTVPAWTSGAHVCHDFTGCRAGFPVKACTFGGGHTNVQSDPGSSVNWIPQESWAFFSQF